MVISQVFGIDISPQLTPDLYLDINVEFKLDDLNRRRYELAEPRHACMLIFGARQTRL
jgi:hypothetical protein